MNKLRYMVLILTALTLQPVLANEALQSAPLFYEGSVYCSISNASNNKVKLYYIQFWHVDGTLARIESNTCFNNELEPRRGCFIHYAPAPTLRSFSPVYCRVQHDGKSGDILGVIQGKPSTHNSAITLMPVVFQSEGPGAINLPELPEGGELAQ